MKRFCRVRLADSDRSDFPLQEIVDDLRGVIGYPNIPQKDGDSLAMMWFSSSELNTYKSIGIKIGRKTVSEVAEELAEAVRDNLSDIL